MIFNELVTEKTLPLTLSPSSLISGFEVSDLDVTGPWGTAVSSQVGIHVYIKGSVELGAAIPLGDYVLQSCSPDEFP